MFNRYRINQVLKDVRLSLLFYLTTLWISFGWTLLSLFLNLMFNLFINSGFSNSNHQLINLVAFFFILHHALKTSRATFSHFIADITFWALENRNYMLLNCLNFVTLIDTTTDQGGFWSNWDDFYQLFIFQISGFLFNFSKFNFSFW